MNRYSNVKEIRNTNEFVGTIGTRYYTNNTYPEVPPNENDIWVETEFGDRLDALAFRFYGDTTLYWIISIRNPNEVSFGSLYLPPGSVIAIPQNVNSIIDSYNILNEQ